ncbi:condensation domain-containing protein [Plantactinospora sp. WMMB334]|uniref:condensation domain-containing protein n=1 Tax=Plantactinospora sp. WMMB334 TaxID=3404119 RepID=UPI003B94F335
MAESEPFPLLPGQAWFMTDLHPRLLHPARWSLARLYRLPPGQSPGSVRAAVAEIWRRHEALRIRVVPAGSGWAQRMADVDTPEPFRLVDLSRVPAAERRAEIERCAIEAHGTLSLEAGPMARFVHLYLGPDEPGRLFLAMHHLAADGLSFMLVQSGLEVLLGTPPGTAPGPAPRAAAYRECVDATVDYASSAELADELDHWAAQPWESCVPLPADHPGHTPETVRGWTTLRTSMRGPEVETLTRRVPAVLGIDLSDILLAAVSEALTAWSGGALSVRAVHHGRTLRRATGTPVLPRRAARTVGWFSTFGCLALRPRTEPDPADYLRRVRDQATAPPNRGAGLALLRWTRPPGAHRELAGRIWRSAQIMFNFGAVGGRLGGDEILGATDEAFGHRPDPLEPRLPLHVRANVAGDEVIVNWDYDPRLRRAETIAAVAERCRRTLYEYATKLG